MINIETRLEQHRHALKKEDAKFYQKLAFWQKDHSNLNKIESFLIKLSSQELSNIKLNTRLIVNLLLAVVQVGKEALIKEMKAQLLDAYIGI